MKWFNRWGTSIRPANTFDYKTIIRTEKDVFGKEAVTYSDLYRSHCYVLTKHKKVIGHCLYYFVQKCLYIESFAISMLHQGKGYSSLLLEYIIKQNQNKTITLHVKQNNISAIFLYKKFNFKEVRRDPKFYLDGETAIFMQR